MRRETERLIIRPFAAEDEAALGAVLSDAETMKYIEPPFSKERAAQFLREAGLCEPPLVFAVQEKRGGVIGHVIFHRYETADCYELGWVLRRDAWGRGYATELTRALLDESRARGLRSVIVECDERQTATRRIAEKFGFRCEENVQGQTVYRLRV